MMLLPIMFLLSLGGGWLLPWWCPALIGYVLGFFIPKQASRAFIGGFVGAGLAWLFLAGYQDWQNHHLLAGRIALLFHLPSGSTTILALTALLGGLTGGLGAWAGWHLGATVKPRFSPTT